MCIRDRAKVDKINALEPEFQALSDEELAAKTQEFRERYAAGESLDLSLIHISLPSVQKEYYGT